MTELEIIPHPDEQRTYAELRSEFRASALSNLRSQYAGKHPIGWNMIGDVETARDNYSADEWAREMLARLDAPVAQSFGLDDVPFTLSQRLEEQAQSAARHDSVTWSDDVDGVADRDAPECAPVATMTDEELCTYIDMAIKESANG